MPRGRNRYRITGAVYPLESARCDISPHPMHTFSGRVERPSLPMVESFVNQLWGGLTWTVARRRTSELAESAVTQPDEPPIEAAAPVPVVDPEHVRLILAGGLFDTRFYTAQLGEDLDAESCIRHYLDGGAASGL